jgi:hypothetical protein
MQATIATRPYERPAYGAMFSIDAIQRASRESGSHFFDADTMRFFGSRVLEPVVAGRFFVTSERSGFDYDAPRAYTLREFMPDASIATVGEFNGYATSGAAKGAARRAAKERHTYYFDGQHGKAGREVCYLVEADDAWQAMERLHRNFRVYDCGRAYDWQLADDRYPRLSA